MNRETDRKVKIWEQHGQTIMLAVIVGALSFTGNALIDAKTAQASMTTEVKGLVAQINRLEGSITSMQMSYVTRGEFAVHEQRIQSIENRKK